MKKCIASSYVIVAPHLTAVLDIQILIRILQMAKLYTGKTILSIWSFKTTELCISNAI